jgi:hypothetical protein
MILRSPRTYKYTGDQSLWLHIKPLKLESQASMGRIEPTVTDTGVELAFLMPNEFQETIDHTWDSYESMIGRAAELFTNIRKEWRALGNTLSTLPSAFEAMQKAGFTETSWKNLAYTAARTLATTEAVSNYRVDFPLVYKNSERRRFDVSVTLINEGGGYVDVVRPVKQLMYYSSPARAMEKQRVPTNDPVGPTIEVEVPSLIDIVLPHVFQVWTMPGKTIYFRWAALKNIQPTYKGPFIKGVPTSCELMLSFTDVEPLFSDFIFPDAKKVNYKEAYKSPK